MTHSGRYRVGIGLVVIALSTTACGGAASPTPAASAGAPATAPKSLEVIKWETPPSFGEVTVNVVGDAGQNLKPYEFWKDDFTKAGITIKVTEVPFDGVYEKLKTEFVAGTGAFDVVTFYPSYIGDFASNGYLEPLDGYLAKQPIARTFSRTRTSSPPTRPSTERISRHRRRGPTGSRSGNSSPARRARSSPARRWTATSSDPRTSRSADSATLGSSTAGQVAVRSTSTTR